MRFGAPPSLGGHGERDLFRGFRADIQSGGSGERARAGLDSDREVPKLGRAADGPDKADVARGLGTAPFSARSAEWLRVAMTT